MGAGVSTEGAPLTRTTCKNNLGVLFDHEAEEKFYATATGPEGEETVPWSVADAYVRTRDERWRDPKHVLFQNLKQFSGARVEIEKIANDKIKGTIREIPQRGQDVGDECQQRGLDGKPVASLDPLYEIAALAREVYANVMNDLCKGGPPLNLAPLKGRARAEVKAQNAYADKTAPCYSWLFDIVRGSVYCDHEDELVALWNKIEADPRIEIVRTKNRFHPPLFNGYRDIMMNVAVKVPIKRGFVARMRGAKKYVSHLCELQIHLTAIKKSEPMHKSHAVYEFFRSFFLGNAAAVERRLDMFCALPVDDAKDADELVEVVLRSDWNVRLLMGLCDLLTSIQEYAGAVKVWEAILAEQERAFGGESKEADMALYELAAAYWRLGDSAKHRDACERALPIYEREYGSDHTEVADVLNNLGNAYGDLGDHAKRRDVLERALAIEEREHGKDSRQVAGMLNNLGEVYSMLGDCAQTRDMLERALAIFERTYGRDHPEVALTLNNLGLAYGALGDQAKKRDVLERALAIKERAYGRDHSDVAITLNNLGSAYGALGDHAKKRDMLERALAIKERAFGYDHTDLASTLYNLGSAYYSLGDYAKARDLQERALAINERAYGRDHPKVAATLTNLANSYGSLGDNAKRRGMLERALAIGERAYGRDHVALVITLWNLAGANRELGDTVKQREILERGLAINESFYGPDHSKTVDFREALEALLHDAAERGDVDTMTQLLNDGAEVDKANEWGATPLYVACENGHVDAARLLLDKGADIDRANNIGVTPLLTACDYGHVDAARLLLDRGADVHRSKSAPPPLSLACYNGHIEIVRLLLTSGAPADLDRRLDALKKLAESRGHTAIVDLLSQYNAP